MDNVRSVALGFWVASGSRLEPVELGGISHFIEHLLFKGSDRFSQWDIARIFDDMGGEPNASTSKEYTLVNARFLDEDLDTAFEVIAEMVARPTFTELDQEREVVLEEVAMYEDSPSDLVHDDLCEAVFGDHPLGRPIIGHRETLARLDLPAVRAYHDQCYVNPGIVVAATGNIDHDRLCELTARHFRPEPGAVVKRPDLSTPPVRHTARFSQKDTEQYHVCLGGPGPLRGQADRYAVRVVDTILGGSWSSRLFQEIREKRALAYSVYSSVEMFADAGLTTIYFGSRDEEGMVEAIEVILGVLDEFQEQVDEDAVTRAKNHLKGQMVISMDSPGSRMGSLGLPVLTDQPVLSLEEVLERIDAVTHDDVMAAARRYYDQSQWSTACIGPRREPFRAVTDGFDWGE